MDEILTAYQTVILRELTHGELSGKALPVQSDDPDTACCAVGGESASVVFRRVLACGGSASVFVLHRDRTEILGVVAECCCIADSGTDLTWTVRPGSGVTVSGLLDVLRADEVGEVRMGDRVLRFRKYPAYSVHPA